MNDIKMSNLPPDSHYLKCMKTVLDSYPQHSPPLKPTQLTEKLYIGNQDNADDISLLNELEISHVLNCVGSRSHDLTRSPYPSEAKIRGFLMIPAQDYDEFNIMQYFEEAIGFIDSAILSGGKVLVHCSIGVNRSGAIVAAYMMVSQKKNLMEVVTEMKNKRLLVLCNMGFRKQLVQFARKNGLLDKNKEEEKIENKTEKQEIKINTDEKNLNEEKHLFQNKLLEQKVEQKKEIKTDEKNRKDALERLVEEISIDELKSRYDNLKKHQKVIDLYSSGIHNYPLHSKYNIETMDQAKNFLSWSKLTDNEKYNLLIDKITIPVADKKDEKPLQPTNSNIRNFHNIDPDIVLKVVNESYDKYKAKEKNFLKSSAPELKTYTHIKPQFTKCKREEKELAREVEDFLAKKPSSGENQSVKMKKLLDPLMTKEDKKLIYGNDKSFQKCQVSNNYDLKTSNTLSSYLNPVSLPLTATALATDYTKNLSVKPLISSKYDAKSLSPPPLPTNFRSTFSPSISKTPPKKTAEEIVSSINSKYKYKPLNKPAVSKNLKNSSDQILKKLSSSNGIKPLSYYKLQVINENLKSDPAKASSPRPHFSSPPPPSISSFPPSSSNHLSPASSSFSFYQKPSKVTPKSYLNSISHLNPLKSRLFKSKK